MSQQIPLTKGKFAIVDDSDFEWLSQFKWHVRKSSTWYAYRAPHFGVWIAMHREIMNCPDGMMVDHADGNGLNNCRSNLRICTRAQNNWNCKRLATATNKYRGVCKFRNKFCAYITVNGKQHHLGLFDDELEAAMVYNTAAIELHGQFARLNIIPETEGAK
jgi:hypothetical protein